jgi:hypothetical protein
MRLLPITADSELSISGQSAHPAGKRLGLILGESALIGPCRTMPRLDGHNWL